MACLCGFILVRNDHFLFAQNGVVMGFLLCQNLKLGFAPPKTRDLKKLVNQN